MIFKVITGSTIKYELKYWLTWIRYICSLISSNFNCKWFKEWADDCCLTPNEHFLSYIMMRTSYMYISMRWWWYLHCTRPIFWIGLLKVIAHWNNSPCIDMLLHLTHYSESTSLCSCSLMLCAYQEIPIMFEFTLLRLYEMYDNRGEYANPYNADAINPL